MARIDFYVLPDSVSPQQFACARVAEERLEGREIHIHAGSRDEAMALDDMLWTFRDISFLPHDLVQGADLRPGPVTIGWQAQAPAGDLLINLAPEVPPFAASFAFVVEPVPGEPELKQQARARFRRYRELGLEPRTHEVDTGHGRD